MNKLMAFPFLLYCTELWVLHKIISRILSVEITFFRDTKVYAKLNHKRNEFIT